MVVGRLLSYWEGNFSGAMLNFQGVLPRSKRHGEPTPPRHRYKPAFQINTLWIMPTLFLQIVEVSRLRDNILWCETPHHTVEQLSHKWKCCEPGSKSQGESLTHKCDSLGGHWIIHTHDQFSGTPSIFAVYPMVLDGHSPLYTPGSWNPAGVSGWPSLQDTQRSKCEIPNRTHRLVSS